MLKSIPIEFKTVLVDACCEKFKWLVNQSGIFYFKGVNLYMNPNIGGDTIRYTEFYYCPYCGQKIPSHFEYKKED